MFLRFFFYYYVSTILNISLMFYYACYVALYIYFSKEFIICYQCFRVEYETLFLLIEFDKRCLIYKLFNSISFSPCFLNRNLDYCCIRVISYMRFFFFLEWFVFYGKLNLNLGIMNNVKAKLRCCCENFILRGIDIRML